MSKLNRLAISVDLDNAAFTDDVAGEIQLILIRIFATINEYSTDDHDHPIRDTNGNTVGSWTFKHRP